MSKTFRDGKSVWPKRPCQQTFPLNFLCLISFVDLWAERRVMSFMTPDVLYWARVSLSVTVVYVSFKFVVVGTWQTVKTRSTRRAHTSLVEADHYSHIAQCKNCWALVVKGYPQRFWIFTCTTIWVCYLYGVFCSFTLRIPRSPPKFNQFFIVLPRTPIHL